MFASGRYPNEGTTGYAMSLTGHNQCKVCGRPLRAVGTAGKYIGRTCWGTPLKTPHVAFGSQHSGGPLPHRYEEDKWPASTGFRSGSPG